MQVVKRRDKFCGSFMHGVESISCWLEGGSEGWFWDEAMVQIDTDTFLVHPPLLIFWIVI